MAIELPGLFVPPLTPFDAEGRIDEAALQRVVDYVVERCRPSAVVVAGVEAQEYGFLTLKERYRLIRRTVEFVGGRRPVVVGISHPDWRQALELAGLARELGAEAVQLLIPSRTAGGAPALEEMLDYFRRVGEGCGLPIVAYHNPGPGAEPGVRGMVEIARLPWVRYVKDSSRDMTRVGQLVAEIDEAGLARYLPTMQVLLPGLLLGASGGTLPPPAARIGADLLDAVRAGNLPEAARLQRVFRLYPGRWMGYGLTAVMKAAARAEGEDWGDPHPPARPLSAADQTELAGHLRAIGALPATRAAQAGRL
jgi:4-hydroxy-tetrahydrodipicolinate synthase